MKRLVAEAFAARDIARDQCLDVVVEPAVPILYFGDLDAYLSSPRRVVTVALNPSREEFPSADPFRRFPLAAEVNGGEPSTYVAALNEYFKTEPYRGWFASFEPLLNGLDASYYPGRANTALHTDLCSPVATDPTWSRLATRTQSALIAAGGPIWHELIRELRPDLIVLSVARRHLATIGFDRIGPPVDIYRLDTGRVRPYVVEGRTIRIDDQQNSLLVFGRAAQKPFSLISNRDKTLIGQAIAMIDDA